MFLCFRLENEVKQKVKQKFMKNFRDLDEKFHCFTYIYIYIRIYIYINKGEFYLKNVGIYKPVFKKLSETVKHVKHQVVRLKHVSLQVKQEVF